MESSRAGHIAGATAAGLLGAGFLLAAISMAASIVDRSDVPVEAVSGTTVAVSVAAACVVATGVLLLARTKHRDLLLLSAAATVLILLSIVGLFSLGMLVAPFAVGAIYFLVRRSAGRADVALPVVGGVAVAMSLSLLLIVWIQPPLVECRDGGAATSSRPWWSSGSSNESSSSGSQVAGTGDLTTGSIETPSGRYIFRCRDGTLTQFRRVAGR